MTAPRGSAGESPAGDGGSRAGGVTDWPRYRLMLVVGVALVGTAGATALTAVPPGGLGAVDGTPRLLGAVTLCATAGCGLVAGGTLLGGIRLVESIRQSVGRRR
jgi:hypothetical protein